MKHKLLNFSKNLIIILGLVVLIVLIFTTSSYAATEKSLGTVMRQTISDWYRFISRMSIVVYVVGYFMIVLKLLGDRTPDSMSTLKESIVRFVVMFFVIFFLDILMISIITLNSKGIELAQTAGTEISGEDMLKNETDLYETALTKAYEISAVPGIIGLVMYLLLVYYTYKFVFVYVKRYINIIVLILLAPIIFVVSTIKRIITGVNDGKITRWIKEFIFNVTLQTFHALFYSILIGFTLKFARSDDTLVLSLLALIFFGFIFKIDGIIRKLFNLVGGSTKISTSKGVKNAIDTIGGGIRAESGEVGNSISFGDDISKKQKEGAQPLINVSAEEHMRQKQAAEGSNASWERQNIHQKKLHNLGGLVGAEGEGKIANVLAEAKADWKDRKNILNGERVKANLTADEKVAAAHEMAEAKGLEGLRQSIHGAGKKAAVSGNKINKKFEKAYKVVDTRVKTAISQTEKDLQHDIEKLNKNVETAKSLVKMARKARKKRNATKSVKRTVNNVQDAVAIVVDTDVDIDGIIDELKTRYGNEMDVSAFVFQEMGAQSVLVPEIGDPKLGMMVLAEEKYEEKASDKIDELVSEQPVKKRTLAKDAKKTIKESGLANKTYTFSRFSGKTARKITNRMLDKTVQSNKYLVVISKAKENLDAGTLTVRGRADKKTVDIDHQIKMSRKDQVNSVRKLKLQQQQAVSQHKELVQETRKVEMANSVAGQVMTAKNAIKLGFMQIDQMTSGQTGMRMMQESGKIRELPSGLVLINQNTASQALLSQVVVNQNASVEERITATGLESKKEPEQVVQFVMTEEGKIIPQVVTKEGKVETPVVTMHPAQIQQQIPLTHFVQVLKPEEQTQMMQKLTEVVTPFIQETEVGNPIMSLQNMQAEQKAEVLQNVLQVFTENVPNAEKIDTKSIVANMQPEAQDQAIQGLVSLLSQYAQNSEQVVREPQTVVTPMTQFAVLLENISKPESQTQEVQTQMVQGFSEVLNQYIKPVEIGNPMMSLQNMQAEQKAEALQNVLQVFNQVVPEDQKINAKELTQNMEPEVQNQAIQGMVNILSQYVQKTEDGTPKLMLETLEPEQRVQVVQNIVEVFTKTTTQTTIQVPQEPIQYTTLLGNIKPREQTHMIQSFSEIVTQYVKPTEIGNPVVAIANMPQEEKTVMLQNVANVVSQYVPSLNQQDATNIVANMQPEAQTKVVQGLIEIFSEHKEVAEDGSLALKLEPSERKEIIQEIAQVFTESVQPKQEVRPQVETKEEVKEEQKQAVQDILKVFEQYMVNPETTVSLNEEVQSSTEKLETMDKIVQHIVNLQGDVIEQVINPEDNTIVTESYQVVETGNNDLLQQINDIVANEDLGIFEGTTSEERMSEFSNLLDDLNRKADSDKLMEQLVDETLLATMEEAEVHTVEEVKQMMYFDPENVQDNLYVTPDEKAREEMLEKRENFNRILENNTVTNNTSSSASYEEDDVLADAIDKLNEAASADEKVDSNDVYDRIENLDSSDADRLLETAAEMERVKIIEEMMNNGGYTVDNPPTDEDIDATVESKMSGLSDLLFGLAKESIDQATEFPREVIEETVNDLADVVANEQQEHAEAEYKKELEKAEKKWAKKHDTEPDNTVIDEYVLGKSDKKSGKGKGENDDENATIKITLKFYGAVKNQGQSVILSNRYSMKDFYDRADKLEGASFAKTEEKFKQDYGSKLASMQLSNFTFAKNPVEDMDGWSIYVMSDRDEIGPEEKDDNKDTEPVEPTIEIIVQSYLKELKEKWKTFLEEYEEITSFDELYKEINSYSKLELIRRFRLVLLKKNEKDPDEKAKKIVDNLYKMLDFKNILEDVNRERKAKEYAAGKVKNAKNDVKATSKKDAEKYAANEFTENEINEYKKKQKSNLLDQILGGINVKQETEDVGETAASFEVQDLLNRMTESVYADLGISKNRRQDKKTLQFDDEGDK